MEKILTQPPFPEIQADEERQGNLLQNYERRFEKKKKLPEDQKLSKLCSEASLNLIEVGQFFYALPSPNGAKKSICMPRIHVTSRSRRNSYKKTVDPKQCTIWPSLGHKSLQSIRKMPIQEEESCKGETKIEINKQLELYSDDTEKMDPTLTVKRSKDILLLPEKLVEKKMPEFLMLELLRNAKKFYQRIQNIGQTK